MIVDPFDPFNYTQFTVEEERIAQTFTQLNRLFIKNYMIDNLRLLMSIDVSNENTKSVEYQTGFYKGAVEALTYVLACHDSANSPIEDTHNG